MGRSRRLGLFRPAILSSLPYGEFYCAPAGGIRPRGANGACATGCLELARQGFFVRVCALHPASVRTGAFLSTPFPGSSPPSIAIQPDQARLPNLSSPPIRGRKVRRLWSKKNPRSFRAPIWKAVSAGEPLAQSGSVTLRAHDLYGREVATLVEEPLPAGMHSFRWEVSQVPAGWYVLKLQTPAGSERRLVCVQR